MLHSRKDNVLIKALVVTALFLLVFAFGIYADVIPEPETTRLDFWTGFIVVLLLFTFLLPLLGKVRPHVAVPSIFMFSILVGLNILIIETVQGQVFSIIAVVNLFGALALIAFLSLWGMIATLTQEAK